MNINLEYYKIFYYTATFGSVTNAARKLCITQPAVSQAIKTLEDEIGMELFIRTRKGVILTEAGNILMNHVKSGYETIILGEKKLSELKNLEFGDIRIGASDMTLQYYLLPYLERFHQLYPNIKVHVTNAPTPSTIEHLYANRIDFGIVTKPFTEDSKLSIVDCRKVEDIFVAGKKFWNLKSKLLSYNDLMKLPIICLEKDTSTRRYVDTFLSSNNVTLTPEFELATSNMIVQFVMRNLGIGCVVSDFADEYIERGDVFKLKFDRGIPKRSMCIISDKSHGMSVAAEKLMELLREKQN